MFEYFNRDIDENTLFISDTHFFRNVREFDNPYTEKTFYQSRGFETVDEMNNYIIKKWNEKVSENDTVYHLGDFSNGSLKETIDLRDKLNGKIHLIIGNHDFNLLKYKKFIDLFESVKDYDECFINNKKVILCHYPILYYNKNNDEGIMLYGHIHNSFTEKNMMKNITKDIKLYSAGMNYSCNYINCYCEIFDYKPQTLSELIAINK